MLGRRPKAVMRQVLRAGMGPPGQLAGSELYHCDKYDEASASIATASCKGSSEVHDQPRGADRRARDERCSRKTVFVPFDRVQRSTVRRHGPSRSREPVVTQVRTQVFGKLGILGRLARMRHV